jgi:flagellar basal-body rod protein FlgB
MLDRLFGDATFQATTHALDAATLRHEVIANNLANINTPGYKRQEVSFEDQLSAALAKGRGLSDTEAASAVAAVKPEVTTAASITMRADGNNVDPEAENVALATNELRFDMLAQQVSGYFSTLKSVINGK